MPIFTAIAAGLTAAATAIGIGATVATAIGAVGAFAARTLLVIGISKLIAKRSTDQGAGNPGASNAGARVQLPPATNNKLPIVYGTAYVAPTITDAMITTDQTTMYYVCALSEVTDSGTISYGNIYYDGQLVAFASPSGADAAKVASLTNNASPPQTDTKIAGNLYIYLFSDGSSSGINTNGQTAVQILSDSSIPAYSRWSSTDTMTKTAFAIVKIVYNQDAGTTQLGQLSFQLQNSLNKPGSVILDYLTNSRYGCAIPASQVETASLTALNTYSDELINYIPVGGGSATQPRYRINGPVNTGQNCLTNLQELTDACDSWLQYSELTGKWKVVINQSYTDYTTFNDLYLIDSSNLIGGIDINPIDLNNTYNSLEVQYPNTFIRDQMDFKVFKLIDYVPSVLSPNEANNQLSVYFPQVNNFIQAAYLGERRLLQSREDLVISCALDYSGIQLEAGDVVRVTLAEYGWNQKLFRVSQVQEVKDESGFLGARISAFEYNDTIYANDPLNDFIPEANTGLTNPKLLNNPGTPILATNPLTAGTVASFNVSSTTPTLGTTIYMDFNYGTSTNTKTHKLYKTVQTSDGLPFGLGVSVSIDVADLPPNTYYWSTTARTDVSGFRSGCSAGFAWNGPNVTSYNKTSGQGGISWNNMDPSAAGALVVVDYTTFDGKVPVAVTSTTTRNIPLIYPGVSVTGTQIFPYAQGTVSAVGSPPGYAVASTAPWLPSTSSAGYASILTLINGTDGYDGWYKLIKNDLSAITWDTDEVIQSQATFNVYTDTANTTIQIVPYARFNVPGISTYDQVQTQRMNMFYLYSAFPYTNSFSVTLNSAATGEVVEVGFYIRNITPGTNVTCFQGSYAVRQAYPFTGSILN